jgi:hypothetical protein
MALLNLNEEQKSFGIGAILGGLATHYVPKLKDKMADGIAMRIHGYNPMNQFGPTPGYMGTGSIDLYNTMNNLAASVNKLTEVVADLQKNYKKGE